MNSLYIGADMVFLLGELFVTRKDRLSEKWMEEWMTVISLTLAFLRFVRTEHPTMA
jgi:hypothetical protein